MHGPETRKAGLMQSSTASAYENQEGRPSIEEVVERYIPLRRMGREFKALCPFHSENTPSFSVNPDKQVFFCFSCNEGGDVIRFIERIEGVGFLEALSILGMRQDQIQGPRNDAIRRKAETVSAWANEQFDQAQKILREIGQRARIAGKLRWREEVERCVGEWKILSVLSDDLQDPMQVMSLWPECESVEAILANAMPEPLPDFPPITPEYRSYLQAVARGDV